MRFGLRLIVIAALGTAAVLVPAGAAFGESICDSGDATSNVQATIALTPGIGSAVSAVGSLDGSGTSMTVGANVEGTFTFGGTVGAIALGASVAAGSGSMVGGSATLAGADPGLGHFIGVGIGGIGVGGDRALGSADDAVTGGVDSGGDAIAFGAGSLATGSTGSASGAGTCNDTGTTVGGDVTPGEPSLPDFGSVANGSGALALPTLAGGR